MTLDCTAWDERTSRHESRVRTDLAFTFMVLSIPASVALHGCTTFPPSRALATDGRIYVRADSHRAEAEALLASAAHDIPCGRDMVTVVTSADLYGQDGATLVAEGCGVRLSYQESLGFVGDPATGKTWLQCSFAQTARLQLRDRLPATRVVGGRDGGRIEDGG